MIRTMGLVDLGSGWHGGSMVFRGRSPAFMPPVFMVGDTRAALGFEGDEVEDEGWGSDRGGRVGL